MQTNHIAILVHDLEAVSQTLPDACIRHEAEEHPAEGTLEQYITIGGDHNPALLLIQAVSEGPYQRSLAKRGPGLHHIGCVCRDIEEEISSGRSGNLLLHPISLETRKHGTVWLCRPGIPFLVELVEDPKQAALEHSKVILRLPEAIFLPDEMRMLSSNLGIETSNGSAVVIEISGTEISIEPAAR